MKTFVSHAVTFEKVYVLHVQLKSLSFEVNKRSPEDALEEAVGLAKAARLEVVEAQICVLSRPNPKALIGKGWCQDIKAALHMHGAQLVLINYTLSPVQQRNLEKQLDCKVIDRTGLILEIFGQRAKTAEGVLQVELATLQYQRSRLVKSWSHLERQRGGFGFLGGPGESQLELDKRMLGDRIKRLQGELARVKRMRTQQRKARKKSDYPLVALVGYTNAGKSTLFNRLTQHKTLAADLLFATLDPTIRQVKLPSGRYILLSDTVGFIADLPTSLISAFRATLEEVVEADLLIHVRDVNHPETVQQQDDVITVLKELGLAHRLETHVMEACNKSDLLTGEAKGILKAQHERQELAPGVGKRHLISAQKGEGIEALLEGIDNFFQHQAVAVTLSFPHHEGKLLAWLYSLGVVTGRCDTEEAIQIEASMPQEALEQLKKRFPECKISRTTQKPGL